MSNLTAKKCKQINKILVVLERATISSTNYVSSKDSFFRNDNNAIMFQQFNKLFADAQIPEGLNRNIKILYHRQKKD